MTRLDIYLFLELFLILRDEKEEGVGDGNDSSFYGSILLIILSLLLQKFKFYLLIIGY